MKMMRKWMHPCPLSMFRRPPEEVLQNVFHVCQGQGADHAGDVFNDTRWDIVLYEIQKLNRNKQDAAGRGELPSPVQHVLQHDLMEHLTVQDCQHGVVRSDYILTINGAMLQQNRGSRVSALFTMVYFIMYSHDSTDRSNSLLTSTRDASKCLGNIPSQGF